MLLVHVKVRPCDAPSPWPCAICPLGSLSFHQEADRTLGRRLQRLISRVRLHALEHGMDHGDLPLLEALDAEAVAQASPRRRALVDAA